MNKSVIQISMENSCSREIGVKRDQKSPFLLLEVRSLDFLGVKVEDHEFSKVLFDGFWEKSFSAEQMQKIVKTRIC